MILLGKEQLNNFFKKHAQSKKPLLVWSRLISSADYSNFNLLRKTFPSADYVNHKYTIFNIAGNKYRLIALINYDVKVVNIKQIWTHSEYSMTKNQVVLTRGQL